MAQSRPATVPQIWRIILLLLVVAITAPAFKAAAEAPPDGPVQPHEVMQDVPVDAPQGSVPAEEVSEEPISPAEDAFIEGLTSGSSGAGPDAGEARDDAAASEDAGEEVVLNFDNADIYEVIRTFAEIFELNHIIDPAVKGTVNISTRGKISSDDLFDIFLTLLKVNGAAAVKQGDVYHIVPVSGVKAKLLKAAKDGDVGRPNDRVVIQAVRLDYIAAPEAAALLQPFVTPNADIKVYAKNNTLLVTDFASNIVKLMEIVELVDINLFREVGIKLYAIENTGAEEVSKDLETLFGALDLTAGSARGVGVKFMPISRINSILVASSVPGVFGEVEKWLGELDSVSGADQEQTFIYQVKNGIAEELADILQAVFSDDGAAKKAAAPGGAAKAAEKTPPRQPLPGDTIQAAAGSATGKVKIMPYATTNTIIIKASKRDYKEVMAILAELDIVPRQVLIETIVAEVMLTDETKLGIEYVLRGDATTGGAREFVLGTALGLSGAGTLASGGFTASVLKNDYLATLNALASENHVNILASPHIIATDGKEASIDIGDEVPLVASKIFIDQREEVTIERRNTGVIFKVTPHINTTGLVTLELSLELSDASSVAVEGESDIRIFQRSAATTMVVQDTQTIVIGGLIDSKTEKEMVKVPGLGDIPVLGLLFRSKKDTVKKTELVLLMTPHVITSLEQANSVTNDFIARLTNLKEKLKEKPDTERLEVD